MPREVSIKITANTEKFDSSVTGMANKVQRSAAEIKAAADKALGSVDDLAKGSTRLARAQAANADAAEAVALAEAKLDAVRKRSKSSVAQNIAAENQLATAQRRSLLAQRELSAAQKAQSGSKFFGSLNENAASINTLSSGLARVGLVAAVGIGAAVKSAADFDAAISGVAATGADARANLGALREAAIKAGADTKFSATEAAGGLEALAKAGVSSKDALGGGLKGALDLAAAGNQSVAESAETAASALNQFGLSGKDVPHVADLLAQAAGTAQGEVSDVAAALNQSGLVANQFGLTIDETTQSLALFAKNGLVGSDAGTSFKTMLTSLYAPTGQGADALKKLGVSAYDASGALKPIGAVADDLKGKLDGLTEQDRNSALKNIFGSDALRAGTILLKDGSAGLANVATEFGKFGSAADVARTKMDNLKGDLEQLKGSFETALIGLGEGGAGPLRELTQNLTGAVNSFNKLGDGTKSAILAVGGIGAASALGVAGVGKLAIGAADAYAAFGKLSTGLPRLAGGLRTAAVAGGVLAAALIAARAAGAASNAIFGDNAKSAEQASTALAGFGKNASLGAVGLNQFLSFQTRGDLFANGTQQINGLGEAFDRLENRGGLTKFSDGLTGLATNITGIKGSAEILTDRFGQLDERLTQVATTNGPEAAASFQAIAKAAADQGVPVEKLVALFPQYAASVRAASEASGAGAISTQQLADLMGGALPSGVGSTSSALDAAGAALDKIGSSAGGAEGDLTALNTALFNTANAALATSNAKIGFQAAIDAAGDAAKKNGENLKSSTAAGRENLTALNNLAAGGQAYVQSLIDQDASTKDVKNATQDARDAFIKSAEAMGKSAPEAKKLADQYGLIPSKVSTTVEAKSDTAKAELGKVKTAIKDLPKKQQVEILSAYKAGGIEAAQAKIKELEGDHPTVKVTTTVDTTALSLAKGDLDYFGHPINATVDVTATGVGETNSQIDSTSRPRQAATRSSATGVGSTNSEIDTTQRGRNASTRSKAAGVATTNSQIDKTARGRTANVKAQAQGVGAVQSAINSIKGKTVNISVVTTKSTRVADNDKADGGLILPGFAAGGHVIRGIGGSRQDNVLGIDRDTGLQTAMVSVGEMVTNAASTAANFAGLSAINAGKGKRFQVTPLATGGIAGMASGGKVSLTTDSEILKAVTAQFHVDQALNLHERRKADQELAKAMKKLNDTQSAALDSIKSLSTSLQEPYRSKSTDVDDVLAGLKDGATDLSAFGAQLKQLKALGLQQGVIDQITADGAINGGELAGQIIAGGQSLVNSLNAANTAIIKAGTALGETSVGLGPKKAGGGYITGAGTGTSDSITARLSNGEYVINAKATAANRAALDAINYGRAKINEHRFMPSYVGSGSSVQPSPPSSYHAGDVILSGDFGGIDRALSAARSAKRDNLTMARLTGSL